MTDITPAQLREVAAKIADALVPAPGDRQLVDDLVAIADRIDWRNAPKTYCRREPKPNCDEPKPRLAPLDFVGEALAHLTNADDIDVPSDVRGARAVRVLSELATRLEMEQR